MCDYCMRHVKTEARVHLRQTDGKWTEKAYHICQRCKDYLVGVYKYAKDT